MTHEIIWKQIKKFYEYIMYTYIMRKINRSIMIRRRVCKQIYISVKF